MVRARGTLFCQELTVRRSTVSSSRSSSLAFCPDPRSGDGRISTFVRSARLRKYCPDHSGDFGCKRDGHFVHMHPRLQSIQPSAEAVATPVEVNDTRAGAVY